MQIQVDCRSKDRRGLIEVAAQFYAQILRIDGLNTNICIKPVRGLRKSLGFRGAITQLSRYELSIAIDSQLDTEDLFTTLAHEMIHAKQYARGHLRIVQDTDGELRYQWLGYLYNSEYMDSPWEQEAFRRERLLANQLCKCFQ